MPMFSLAEWEQYKNRRDAEGHQSVVNPRKNWEWEAKYIQGVEGVDTTKSQIEWYMQSHSRYGADGSHMQSYEEFMETGPHVELPNDEILDELYDAVKMLMQR